MLFDLIFALCAQINQSFTFAVSINYFRNVFNVVVIQFNRIFFEQSQIMRKEDLMIVSFAECQIIEKRIAKNYKFLISNKHIYVNDESFLKIYKDKSKNAEFSLRFQKDVNQLNEILFVFELNVSIYFSVQENVLSIAIDTFEITANHIYDSKKKTSILSNKNLESEKKKKTNLKVDKKEIF